MESLLHALGDFVLAHIGLVTVGLFVGVVAIESLSEPAADQADASPRRMATNFGLMLINAGVALFLPVSSIIVAGWAEEARFGLFQWIDATWWIVLPATILVRTLVQYWLHRAMHRVPLLWRFHSVHHSDTSVDVSLSLRQHPLDIVPRLFISVITVALFGMPVWAVVLVDTLLAAFNLWEHADARLPHWARRTLRGMVATPEFHRYHHSAHKPQTDSNYGSCLVLWDRAFGTFTAPGSEPIERIGLGDGYDGRASSLTGQLWLPFTALHRPEGAARDVCGPHSATRHSG